MIRKEDIAEVAAGVLFRLCSTPAAMENTPRGIAWQAMEIAREFCKQVEALEAENDR